MEKKKKVVATNLPAAANLPATAARQTRDLHVLNPCPIQLLNRFSLTCTLQPRRTLQHRGDLILPGEFHGGLPLNAPHPVVYLLSLPTSSPG